MSVAELQDQTNHPDRGWQGLGPSQRSVEAEHRLKATVTVRASRPAPPREAVRDGLQELERRVGALDWSPRTGATDRRVLAALLQLGIDCASDEVEASIRHLGALAHITKITASAALGRLTERGYIVPVSDDRRGHADHARRFRILGWEPGPEGGAELAIKPCCGDGLLVRTTPLLDDIFSGGRRLGPGCRETWEALTGEPRKVTDLVAAHPGRPVPATVRTRLKTLRFHGLADNKGHRWWRLEPGEASLLLTATGLGVKGRLEARRSRAEREREAYYARFTVSYELESASTPSFGPVLAH